MENTTPTFNPESQKQLARLMATENIRIRVGNYSTAFFDTKNRVLGLPSWNFKNKHISDLLIGHEIGHALFTPEDAIDLFKARFPGKPFSICNIIEDIREERLTCETYPGWVYSLKKGYEALFEMDLFEIKDKDTSTLGFADRLNIRSKSRRTDLAPLSKEEEDFYQKTLKAKTFDDVLDLCEEAYKMLEDEDDSQEQEGDDAHEGPQANEDEGENGTPEDGNDDTMKDFPDPGNSEAGEDESEESGSEPGGDEEGDEEGSKPQPASTEPGENQDDEGSQIKQSPSNGASDAGDDYDHDLHAETMDNLEKNLSENQVNYGEQTTLVDTPTHSTLLKEIININDVRAARQQHLDRYNNTMTDPDIHQSWVQYKNDTKKHIAPLVKEFERKKAAYQYSRATIARTGQLDVNKLHTYKYDDQIFKSVSQLANAKDHGMVFMIDYSGSMNSQLKNVIDQTLQLVVFCKMVNIPFEVYAFTSPRHWNSWDNLNPPPEFGIHMDFAGVQVIELLNSSLKKNEFDEAMKELWIQNRPQVTDHPASYTQNYLRSKYEELGGTPLNQSLLILNSIIKRFQKNNPVQKTNVIILTDGDGGWVSIYDNDNKAAAKSKKGGRSDQKMYVNGNLVPVQGTRGYKSIIGAIKKLPNTTVVGFFMANRSKDASNQLHHAVYNSQAYRSNGGYHGTKEKIMKKARGLNFYEILGGFGYDAYYIMKNSSATEIHDENILDSIDNAEVDASDAKSRTMLAKAFTKMTGDRKTTRIFLNKFAELIA